VGKPKNNFSPRLEQRFDHRDPTQILPKSNLTTNEKPNKRLKIQVGVTQKSGEEDDVVLEPQEVEIGQLETYRSLLTRLLKRNNFEIKNLKNLKGYPLPNAIDDNVRNETNVDLV